MTKKRMITILAVLLIVVAIVVTFISCRSTTYKLYSYKNYELGDNFYGMKIDEDMVQVTIKNGKLTLKIDKGFHNGQKSDNGIYETYNGTYSEDETTMIAYVPEYENGYITVRKAGDYLIISTLNGIIVVKK